MTRGREKGSERHAHTKRQREREEQYTRRNVSSYSCHRQTGAGERQQLWLRVSATCSLSRSLSRSPRDSRLQNKRQTRLHLPRDSQLLLSASVAAAAAAAPPARSGRRRHLTASHAATCLHAAAGEVAAATAAAVAMATFEDRLSWLDGAAAAVAAGASGRQQRRLETRRMLSLFPSFSRELVDPHCFNQVVCMMPPLFSMALSLCLSLSSSSRGRHLSVFPSPCEYRRRLFANRSSELFSVFAFTISSSDKRESRDGEIS